jgi:hypothetical protein
MHSVFRRMLLGASYVLAAVTLATVPAIASGATWSVTPVPGARTSSASVSCASSSRCFAVGRLQNGSGANKELGLVHEWNGTEWRPVSTGDYENPSEAVSSQLSGVSCASSTACTAVGSYKNTSGTEVTLALEENGSGFWFAQKPPNPKEAVLSQLLGVSCTSSEACTAVGYYDKGALTSELTLAERWNGKEWTIQETPNPKEIKGVRLTGVSCTSSEACTAVGYYAFRVGELEHTATLAERWNGKVWTIQEPPNPKEARFSNLSGISCTSSEVCTAVGSYTNAEDTISYTLAERWNGKVWTIQETPNPTGAKTGDLSGVSCASSEACTAIGWYTNSTGSHLTLAERWNGKAWTIQETPNPTNSSELAGVSCTSSEACIAVGQYTESSGLETAFAERLNGATWLVTPVPGARTSSASVSCASSSRCFAVGRIKNGSHANSELGLVHEWNGTEWLTASTGVKYENPSEAVSSQLSGVSCASSTACTAVGSYTNTAGTEVTLAESGPGFWFAQKPPNPKEAVRSHLLGVSCTSAEACMAVGYYDKGAFNSQLTLAERWNGKEWTIQETPNPTEIKGVQLNGVSCTSSEACTAVGYYTFLVGEREHSATLAERWNGKVWTIQEPPNPKEARFSNLSGISCTSSEVCTAVGSYTNAEDTISYTLAERWNGKVWTIQETPNPTGAKTGDLSGVSCASSEACTAIGWYTNSTGSHLTLAERWNGKAWTIQETPNPTNSSELAGVSCTSSEACIAVGQYTESSGLEATLAERYS